MYTYVSITYMELILLQIYRKNELRNRMTVPPSMGHKGLIVNVKMMIDDNDGESYAIAFTVTRSQPN